MPRRRRIRHHARRFAYHPIRRHKGLTPVRLIKWGIALAPTAAYALEPVMSGDYKGGAGRFVEAYTGYNFTSQTFKPYVAIQTGYLPMIAAWLFGKIASRVLR